LKKNLNLSIIYQDNDIVVVNKPAGIVTHRANLKSKISKIKTEEKEVETKVLETKEFKIESALMSHGTPTLAYSFIIKDKLRLDKQKIKKLN